MTRYRVYRNDGLGGPVDFSAPAADTAALSWASPPLAPGGDYTWVVRPWDDVTGYEDATADARVRVLTGPDGSDATPLPPAPKYLAARPTAGGTAAVTWYWPRGRPVAGFHVYAWVDGGPPDFTAPAGAVPASNPAAVSSSARPYRFTLGGLADGVTYRVCVRGYNPSGEGVNTAAVAVTAVASGPPSVPSLTASVSP